MELFINIMGFMLLWASTDIGRNDESKIVMFSRNWWVIVLLLTFGAILSQFQST